MDLAALSQLGLPGWVIIVAALIFIAKQVGLLDYVLGFFTDVREHRQQSENIAIEVLQGIIRESIQEYSQEMKGLDKAIYRLGRQVDNNTQSVRALAGIIEKDRQEP